jgi:hypothetical protein
MISAATIPWQTTLTLEPTPHQTANRKKNNMADYKLLFENLFNGDLADMIRPVISIDDFESKIDDEVIVIAFYAKNDESAEDLSVFLERSKLDQILDTEVSSTPNKDGDYLIFVELDVKTSTISEVADLIIEISKIAALLTDEQDWKIKNIRFLKNKVYPATETNIKILLKKIKEEKRD